MHNVELLVSASNLENLKMAILSGADAVYIGGESFGVNNMKDHFTKEELQEGIKFAHDNNKNIFISISIMPHSEDLRSLEEYLNEIKYLDVDAIVVSDPGALVIVKKIMPNTNIHMGPQANVTNYHSVNFWYNQGVKRIMATSELSIDEIGKIRLKTPIDMEIEVFVHGPICVSHSGRRLLSSYINDKNNIDYNDISNKNFNLLEEKRQGEYYPVYEDERGTFFFNSKDLCMLKYIPQLIKAGVTSLKIDGRLQSDECLNTVIKVYRNAIDEFYKNPNEWKFKVEWLDEIKKYNNRPLTHAFYTGSTIPDDYEE
ncbi:MAG: peptidase U32 family protein [Paraclostridium sp.]